MNDQPDANDTFNLEIVKVGKDYRCAYLNDYRIAGSKPYVSEGPQTVKTWKVKLRDLVGAIPWIDAWRDFYTLLMDRMGGNVQAWGVFAEVDGQWCLQLPVYPTEDLAHQAKDTFTKGTILRVSPLGVPGLDWIPHMKTRIYPPQGVEVLWLDLCDGLDEPCHHLGELKDDGTVALATYGNADDLCIQVNKFEAWMLVPGYNRG